MTPIERLKSAEYAHSGMTIDVVNMLRQSGNEARHYRHDLSLLGEHLRELKTRWLAGDETVVAEFFALYKIG